MTLYKSKNLNIETFHRSNDATIVALLRRGTILMGCAPTKSLAQILRKFL